MSGSSSRGTFWKISSYLVTNFSVTLFWVFFFVLNRTRVIGRHHVGEAPNTILLSNHQSMIDSFLVGLAAYYPRSLVKPYLLPWNPAAAENFYKNPCSSDSMSSSMPSPVSRADVRNARSTPPAT